MNNIISKAHLNRIQKILFSKALNFLQIPLFQPTHTNLAQNFCFAVQRGQGFFGLFVLIWAFLNNILKGQVFIWTVLAFLAGCKTQKPLSDKALKTLPASYSNMKDSANAANLNWKQFFADTLLLKLIDTAIHNNLDISIAWQRIEVARANVGASRGLMIPTLGASVGAAQRKFGLYTMDGSGNISTEITPGRIVPIHLPDYYVGLVSSWEVDLWGKLRKKKKAAAYRYMSSVEGRNLVITNLVADLANAYYGLLALDNELDIIRETIELMQNAFELIQIQKQAGAANELAVKQFEAQLLNSKALEYENLQKIVEMENVVNFLLNRYPQPILRNKSQFTKPLPFNISVGIPSELLKNRPDLRQAEFEILSAGADVKAARAMFYPSLNISGSIGFQAFQTGLLLTTPQSLAYALVGGLAQPLLNRSAIKSVLRTASANRQEALFKYQKIIITSFNEVFNELSSIRNLEQIHSLKSSEVAVLSQAIDASSVLFRTGRANYIEVLMTQKSTLASRIDLVSTRQRQYNSIINLYKALGGGWR